MVPEGDWKKILKLEKTGQGPLNEVIQYVNMKLEYGCKIKG